MKRSVEIRFHIVFWVIIVVGNFLPVIITYYIPVERYGKALMVVQFLPPLFFYLGYFVVMHIKNKKSFFWYLLIFVTLSYLLVFLISTEKFAYGLIPLSKIFFWTILGSISRFFIDWFRTRNKMNTLEKQNLKSELALLRSQVNPHFLFNTLNNIDALVLKNPAKASEFLIKTSDIMRYMLNESSREFVLLENELKHIEDYIELERIRLKNYNFVNYQLTGHNDSIKIAPMLFIPFIENAFKHSVDSDLANGININISILENNIVFKCENLYDPKKQQNESETSIGLSTVKKRLSLIYPRRHKLDIINDGRNYNVCLKINFDEN